MARWSDEYQGIDKISIYFDGENGTNLSSNIKYPYEGEDVRAWRLTVTQQSLGFLFQVTSILSRHSLLGGIKITRRAHFEVYGRGNDTGKVAHIELLVFFQKTL